MKSRRKTSATGGLGVAVRRASYHAGSPLPRRRICGLPRPPLYGAAGRQPARDNRWRPGQAGRRSCEGGGALVNVSNSIPSTSGGRGRGPRLEASADSGEGLAVLAWAKKSPLHRRRACPAPSSSRHFQRFRPIRQWGKIMAARPTTTAVAEEGHAGGGCTRPPTAIVTHCAEQVFCFGGDGPGRTLPLPPLGEAAVERRWLAGCRLRADRGCPGRRIRRE